MDNFSDEARETFAHAEFEKYNDTLGDQYWVGHDEALSLAIDKIKEHIE